CDLPGDRRDQWVAAERRTSERRRRGNAYAGAELIDTHCQRTSGEAAHLIESRLNIHQTAARRRHKASKWRPMALWRRKIRRMRIASSMTRMSDILPPGG